MDDTVEAQVGVLPAKPWLELGRGDVEVKGVRGQWGGDEDIRGREAHKTKIPRESQAVTRLEELPGLVPAAVEMPDGQR